MTDDPHKEAKALIKSWCDIQREKYGENWKEAKAKEMTEQMMPTINAILDLGKEQK